MASRSSADKLKPLPPDPDRHQHSAIPPRGVISIAPGDTVLSALKLMQEKDIGAVVVLEGGKLQPISLRWIGRALARASVTTRRSASECGCPEQEKDRGATL